MAAPQGNEFWKQRSKHGRDKIFSSPEQLWSAACEYFEHVDNCPEEVEVPHVKFGTITVKHKQPYLKSDFVNFIGINSWDSVKYYEKEQGFSEIITRIDNIIFSQKYRGAAIGIFKENLIARELGLKEHQETTLVEEFIVLRTENNGETVTKTD
jgi:hypothetical protein